LLCNCQLLYCSRDLPMAFLPDIAPSRMFTTNSLCLIVCPIHEWHLLFKIFKSRWLVTTYKIKECHNSEDHNPIFHHCEVLRSYPYIFCIVCVWQLCITLSWQLVSLLLPLLYIFSDAVFVFVFVFIKRSSNPYKADTYRILNLSYTIQR
jgi:hypothetical protein